MKKILMATSFFPTSACDNLPQFLREQAVAVAEQHPDIEILVVTSSRTGKKDAGLPSNITTRRFDYCWPTSRQQLTELGIMPAIKFNKFNILALPLFFLFQFLAIYKATKKFKPDLIYSHWFLPQGINCHLISKIFNIPHSFTSHSYDVEVCKKIPFIGKTLVHAAFEHMTACTVVSQKTLEGIKYFYSNEEWENIKNKIQIIPMGIATPQKTTAQKKDFSVVFLGRFVPKKGIHFLLEAVAELAKDLKNIHLTLAGDGPEKKDIIKKVAQLDISAHVAMPGFVTEKAKQKLLETTDLYVLPSIDDGSGDREGLPVSLLEAMSYGAICIATYNSGVEDVVADGINGYLVEQKNASSLQQKIRQALSKAAESKNQMRLEAQSTAQNYYWNKIANQTFEHLFSDLESERK